MMTRIAILVSARIDRDDRARISHDERPRRDYWELARALNADIINHDEVVSRAWRGGSKTGFAPAVAQAIHAFRRRDEYDCIVSDSEHVGLPLAMLLKLANAPQRHVMIAHRLSAAKKSAFFRLGVASHLDKIICYGSAQAAHAQRKLGVPASKLAVVLHAADHRFWRPLPGWEDRLIASAGLEYRDYPTLIEAVRGLDVKLTIAAASPWSRRRDEASAADLPPNVRVVSHSYRSLRELYARARFVVVPLYETDFQAGSLVTYEAMGMGKAVIATRTKGHGDVVVDGATGLYVPPGDPAALRAAISRLLVQPEQALAMGRRARATVEAGLNLDRCVADVAMLVRGVCAARTSCLGVAA